MSVCPKEAIFADDELSRIMIDYDKCIGCRMCVAACPFGAMEFDAEIKRVVKCDLCDGDPMCAKLCAYGAIRYVDEQEESAAKTMDVAEKLRKMLTGSSI
jgi:Fe-S-cluster-containing hydrogenase component 2